MFWDTMDEQQLPGAVPQTAICSNLPWPQEHSQAFWILDSGQSNQLQTHSRLWPSELGQHCTVGKAAD